MWRPAGSTPTGTDVSGPRRTVSVRASTVRPRASVTAGAVPRVEAVWGTDWRRGAVVLHAPAMKIAPVEEDHLLMQDTAAILHARPDITLITTAYGMRRWSEAADAHGLGEDLMDVLEASRIFVRGPKARGAVRRQPALEGVQKRVEHVAYLLVGRAETDAPGWQLVAQARSVLGDALTDQIVAVNEAPSAAQLEGDEAAPAAEATEES